MTVIKTQVKMKHGNGTAGVSETNRLGPLHFKENGQMYDGIMA